MLGIAVRKLVTLPSSTLGLVCDLLEKLSDEEWVVSTKRFLRKENPWEAITAPDFRVWKTIKLGTHKDVECLKSAITDAGFRIGDWASDIMGKPAFTVAREEIEIELFTATVAELGFKGNTRYDVICTRICELGYKLCPAEVGPQLRRQHTDQPINEWLVIAMEAIAYSDGYLCVFYVAHDDEGLWLNTGYGSPDGLLDPRGRFVFVRRK